MNYIHQINGFWAKAESSNLKGIDIAVYFALLKYCNSLNWLNPFVCHWSVVCQYANVSKNSYYNSLKNLEDSGLIKQEKGERNKKPPKVFVLKLKNNKGTIKEQEGNKKGTEEEQKGNLYKLLNYKTIKLLNDNAELVNSNIEKWITETSSDATKPSKEIFLSWITELKRTEKFGNALWDYMNGRDWRTANDEPIKNWKTYCSSVIRSDDWDWGKLQDEAREQLYKDAVWLSQSRGRSYLIEETARNQLGMGRLNSEMEKRTKRYLENKKIVGLNDNSIHEFLRNRGR